MSFSAPKLWLFAKDYILIIFGIALYGLGFCAFIATAPDKVVIGGMAGLSQVVDMITFGLWGFHVPYSVTIFTVNILMLTMAYKVVGRTFVVRTLFGVVVISSVFAVFQPLFTQPPVEGQTFMDIIIGAVLCGLGIGLVFIHNGSTGGTDIVAAVASKKSNVSIGRAMMYFDLSIITSSMLLKFVFVPDFDFQAAVPPLVYGLITLFVVPFMADMMINTNRMAVQFTIFSPKWEEIATAINNEAQRGCTVLNGMGWYSKQEVKVLLVMCRKIESVTIFRIIKSIDKDAFITQAEVNGVYGKGFDEIKLKMRPSAHGREHEKVNLSHRPEPNSRVI
ncbi:MAG: YitT family protein [Bacteroidales bacterium]|nr:YitT family protein [Bacteroidales bacterium]